MMANARGTPCIYISSSLNACSVPRGGSQYVYQYVPLACACVRLCKLFCLHAFCWIFVVIGQQQQQQQHKCAQVHTILFIYSISLMLFCRLTTNLLRHVCAPFVSACVCLCSMHFWHAFRWYDPDFAVVFIIILEIVLIVFIELWTENWAKSILSE